MARLTLSGVGKSFGAVEVIRDVDLDVEHGEFVVLVGPSGCGKSTLLRMIAGLESTSRGSIRIGDREVNDLKSKERDIAMVFQSYALYPHMTVARNMGFALWLQKVPKDEIADRVRQAADVLNLTDYLDRYPRQLSGGQRQRVAMGRAIVRNPRVFLFDEPLSNLDAKLRVAMRSEIRQLHHRLGATIVYVTHDQIEAMTMADKIVILNGGRVEQVGAPLDLYDRPCNAFVAGFIGSPAMNFVAGAVQGGAVALEGGGALPLPPGTSVAEGAPVTLGVRPEHLVPAGPSGEGVAMRVATVEPTGSETHVIGSAAGQPFVAVVRERIAARPGDTVAMTAAAAHIHLFDPDTGSRITD